jgi:hypothetical protein
MGAKGLFKSIGFISLGAGIAGMIYSNKKEKAVKQETLKVNKFKDYYYLLNEWLKLKQEGKSLEQFFLDHDYRTIAIYGMGELGNRIKDELKNSEIIIGYGIDKNLSSTTSDLKIVTMDSQLEPVDVIVVTAIFDFSNIKDELENVVDYKVISLEEVVHGLKE